MDSPVRVELVDPDEVRPLRHAVLRPGRPAEVLVYPGDDHPDAAHVAVRAGIEAGPASPSTSAAPAEVVAVGSVVPEAPPWDPSRRPAWRVRGMATVEDRRGSGLGRRVLDTLLAQVARRGGGLVWCHARTGAQHFYERAGFGCRGEPFDLPDIGPHVPMARRVDAGAAGLGQDPPPVPT